MAQQRNIPAEQHQRWREAQQRIAAAEHDQRDIPDPRTWLDPRRADPRVQIAAAEIARRTGLTPAQASTYAISVVQALSDHGHLNGPALPSPEETPAA